MHYLFISFFLQDSDWTVTLTVTRNDNDVIITWYMMCKNVSMFIVSNVNFLRYWCTCIIFIIRGNQSVRYIVTYCCIIWFYSFVWVTEKFWRINSIPKHWQITYFVLYILWFITKAYQSFLYITVCHNCLIFSKNASKQKCWFSIMQLHNAILAYWFLKIWPIPQCTSRHLA